MRYTLLSTSILCCFGLTVLVGAPKAALADGWRYGVGVTEAGVWDTNPLMRTRGEEEIFGSMTTARLSVARETETRKMGLKTWVDENIFDKSAFNSTDFHGLGDYAWKGQRTQFTLKMNGDYDTTRTSEVVDLSLATKLVRRTALGLQPRISYSLSPISRIDLDGSVADISYDEDTHTDYRTYAVSSSYNRNFSELWGAMLSLRARRYETQEGLKKVVDSVGPMLGVFASFSDTLSAQASAGEEASRQKLEGVVIQPWQWNYVFAVEGTYKTDQDTLKLGATRAQQSYGNGNDDLLTTLELSNKHKINTRLMVDGKLSYQFSESSDSSSSSLDEMYVGMAGITYKATEAIDLTASYRYRHEVLKDSDKAARQNVARIGLTYNWDSGL